MNLKLGAAEKMAETYPNNFLAGDTDESDRDSGVGMKSGANSIKLDSEAQSVRSWESESENGSWQNDSEDEDDDALGKLLCLDISICFLIKRKFS